MLALEKAIKSGNLVIPDATFNEIVTSIEQSMEEVKLELELIE
jgi:hypothetical protein